jgi:membrane protein
MWPKLRDSLEHWLFSTGDSRRSSWRLRRVAAYAYALLRDLLGGKLRLHAMGLVYATLLALVPLLAFSFAILRAFGGHRELEPIVFEFFRPMGAAATDITRRVMEFAENVRAGLVGSVGLALLIWTLLGTLKKVEDSLNFVWQVEVSRSFARRIAEYLSLLILGPLLMFAAVGLSQLVYNSSSTRLIAALPWLGHVNALVLKLLPFVVVSVLFTLVYRLAPNTRVRWWPAIVGGAVAGIAWALAGAVFAAFVVLSARMIMVYAGLAILIAALLWTYFGWLILLLGARLSFYVQNPGYLRVGLTEPRLSNNETEQLALGVMYLVGGAHLAGNQRWTIASLASRLQLPGIVVARSVTALEAAGLLVSSEQEALLPARDLSAISVVDILGVARSRHTDIRGQRLAIPEAVATLCSELDAHWRAQCGTRSLRELLTSAATG